MTSVCSLIVGHELSATSASSKLPTPLSKEFDIANWFEAGGVVLERSLSFLLSWSPSRSSASVSIRLKSKGEKGTCVVHEASISLEIVLKFFADAGNFIFLESDETSKACTKTKPAKQAKRNDQNEATETSETIASHADVPTIVGLSRVPRGGTRDKPKNVCVGG